VFGIPQSLTPSEFNPFAALEFSPFFAGLFSPLAPSTSVPSFWGCCLPQNLFDLLPLLSSVSWPLRSQSLLFGIAQSFGPFDLSPLSLGLLNPLIPFELHPSTLGLQTLVGRDLVSSRNTTRSSTGVDQSLGDALRQLLWPPCKHLLIQQHRTRTVLR